MRVHWLVVRVCVGRHAFTYKIHLTERISNSQFLIITEMVENMRTAIISRSTQAWPCRSLAHRQTYYKTKLHVLLLHGPCDPRLECNRWLFLSVRLASTTSAATKALSIPHSTRAAPTSIDRPWHCGVFACSIRMGKRAVAIISGRGITKIIIMIIFQIYPQI